ncbi:MAG: hypothetical protein Q4F05_03305 [bacterium]|nr:hypothetical protein [bacterium]
MEENTQTIEPYRGRWKDAMAKVKWGVFLTFVNISLAEFPLAQITGFLGSILLLYGLFLLKEENQSLHKAYLLGIGFFAYRVIITIVFEYQSEGLLTVLALFLRTGLFYEIAVQLEKGMYQENHDPDQVQSIAHAYSTIRRSLIGILVIQLFSTYVMELSWIGLCLLLAFVISILKNLEPVELVLDNIADTKEKNRPKGSARLYTIIVSGTLLVLLLVPAARYVSLHDSLHEYTGNQVNMDLDDIVNQMKKAGFPEEILIDLSSEEIANYDKVTKVVVRKNLSSQFLRHDGNSDEDDETRRKREDLSKLELTVVYSYFEEQLTSPRTVRVLTYGKWKETPGHAYTDCFYFNHDVNMTLNPIAYGIYTADLGMEKQYRIDADSMLRDDFWNYSTIDTYRYTIPRNGYNYRFIAAQTIEVEQEEYDELGGQEQEYFDRYQLNYYHRVGFPIWNTMDLSDYYTSFHEQRQYYFITG